jgi:hypothetical protein
VTEQRKPEGPPTPETEIGVPEFQRTPGTAEGEDPEDAQGKPQGTLEDQEKNMDSEGHPVEPPSNAG